MLYGDCPHGNQKMYDGQYLDICHKTMAREAILENNRDSVVEIWESNWICLKDLMGDLFRKDLAQRAQLRSRRTRVGLKGARAEVVQTYKRCNRHKKVRYFDAVRPYPTASSFHEYGV